MEPGLISVVAQAVTYVVFGILGAVLYVLHGKGEANAEDISKVGREVAGLGGRFIGREEVEAQRQENRHDHQRLFDKLEDLTKTTTGLAGQVRRMNGGPNDPEH